MSVVPFLGIVRGPVARPWGIAVVLLLAILLIVHRGGLNERHGEGVAWIPLLSHNLDPGALYARDDVQRPEQQIFARLSLPEGEGPFPAAVLLQKAAKISKGSGTPNTNKVAKLNREQLEEIAKIKMPDLTAADMDAAVRTVAGTARSMGIEVEGVN